MKKAILLQVFFCAFFLQAAHAGTLNVLALLSFDNPVYKEIIKGFESGATAKGSAANVKQQVMQGGDALNTSGINVVFAIGTRALEAAKTQAGSTPVVFSLVYKQQGDTSAGGGVTLVFPPELELAKIKNYMPDRTKIGIIYSDESKKIYEGINGAAASAGVSVIGKYIPDSGGFSAAFGELASSTNCFLMIPDAKIFTPAVLKSLFADSAVKKYPVVGLSAMYTKAGAVMSLDYDYADIGAQCGELAADGAFNKVVYPRKAKISVNTKSAAAMGVKLDAGAVAKADQSF